MHDAVFDASVVAFSNGDLAGRRSGNAIDVRLRTVENALSGRSRVRYNPKLLKEYGDHVKHYRNDVIASFFALLDSQKSVFVKRNTLSSSKHDLANGRCRWPSHDQHLLAAAVGGNKPEVFVTEGALAACSACIKRHFKIDVVHV